MRLRLLCLLLLLGTGSAWAQAAPSPAPKPERKRFLKGVRDISLQPLPPKNEGQVQFRGQQSFTEADLRTALADPLQEIASKGLTKPRADDAAYLLSVHYRKQGFAAAEATFAIQGPVLVLTIKEGPRTFLRKITFAGNKQESSAVLYEYMIGQTEERLVQTPNEFPFVEADMQTGAARIRGLYESSGHLDAVVEDPVIKYTAGRAAAEVFIKIQEGPRYTLGEIKFLGQSTFNREELLQALGEPLSNPYTVQRVNTMEKNLQFFLKSKGYYTADVESAATKDKYKTGRLNNRLVPVTFTIKQGAQYHFDGVQVTGLDRLRPSFVKNRFKDLSGQIYSPQALDEHYRELLSTGLFNNLRLSPTAPPTNEVRIDLTAEEAKSKELGFSIGFSSYEGFVLGTRVAERNLMGTGRPLSLSLEYTSRALRAELLYLDPWFLESDYSLRARIFAQGREEIGYAKQDTGLRLELARKLTKNIELSIFLQAKNVEITEAEIEQQFLGATGYQMANVGFTQSFDYRDSPVSPSKGWIINNSVDGGVIAGELAFLRAAARFSYYIPVKRRYLLALGARGGLIFPVTDIPIDERFFNGGSTTVRSFRERELGPRDKGDYPIGGQVFTVFNAEFIFPIKGDLQGAVFVDAGNVISTFEEASLNELRYAVGLGVRYKLPIGPVRLDVGFNPQPKQGESWGAIHFSFGFAF